MTPLVLDLVKTFGGVLLAAALGGLGWAVNRMVTKMDGLDKRLGDVERGITRADERWRAFVEGRSSPSGSWPIVRPQQDPWRPL